MNTFKSKLGVGALLAVLIITLLLYLVVIVPWAGQIDTQAQSDVRRAAELVQRIQRLHAYDLVALAKEVALQPDLIDAIQQEEESPRRQGVYDAISDFDRRLRTENRKADFFAVVDHRGRVVARDLNIEDMYGEQLPYPAIARALAGKAGSDVWFMKNQMMRAGAAPIIAGGEIRGAVVIAYEFTAAEARQEALQVNTHVLYYMDNAVRASSFTRGGSSEDSAKVKMVSAQLMHETSPASKALASATISKPYMMSVNGEEYLTVAGPLPEAVTILGIELSTRILKGGKRAETISGTSEHKVGFAVMVPLDERHAPVLRARWAVTVFAGLLLLVVFGVMWMVSMHFVTAEDRLELGVNEVINGNMDYTFDAMQEFEGLANALNVMLARLLGRPEPGEEEDGDAAWRPDVLAIADLDGSTGVNIQALAAESDDAYFSRLHREYVQARQAAGLSVDGITLDSFSQKIRANEAMLKAKHKHNMIRFVVHAEGGRVSLKPIKIG